MLRKLSLVAVAAASLGVAALAPTSASAWGGAWWLARRRWHPAGADRVFIGWPGLFWLRRLLCAALGPDAVGTPLAAGKPLLLSSTPILAQKPRPCRGRGFHLSSVVEPPAAFMKFLLER